MTDHQNSVRIVSEEIDVRLLVKMSRLAVKHVSSILKVIFRSRNLSHKISNQIS